MSSTSTSLLYKLRSKTDSAAWSRFAEVYTPLLMHWVGQLGLQDSDRTDVVQDVFVVLINKLSTFQYDRQQSFRAWLRTVTINKCRDFVRRARRKVEPQLLEGIEAVVDDETSLLTEDEYRNYVASAALAAMKKHFAETTWRACWEHVAEGRSAPDVAEELGISVNAVYLARGRVLKRLRSELQGLWD